MFFQPPENEPTNTNTLGVKSAGAQKSARRKRRKLEQKFKNKSQLLKKEKQRFANTMSSWAENFTMASTWQLKHQVAHWKSRATALEYENNILRTMLRQYYVKGHVSKNTQKTTEANAEAMSAESGSDTEEVPQEKEDDEESEGKLEISEEFLEFLKGNAENRRIRIERERARKLEAEMPMRLLEACPVGPADHKAEYEKLYGVHWQKITALEMSMQSQFISDCDREKPVYWPTIPFRM